MIKEHPITPEVLARLPDVVETLRACDSVQALFFFGSLAEGKLQPLSDLDLAVLLRPAKSGDELFDLQLELIGAVSEQLRCEEFDLMVLNLAPLRFAYQVLKQGRLIFVKDLQQLIDFRERVVKRYLDFVYYRRSYDRFFMQRMGLPGDERILERLKLLNQYILYLRELAGVDEKEVLRDFRVRGSAERYLQLAIESCINMGNRMLSLLQFQKPVRTPETYADIFVELGKLEVIPTEFVDSMIKLVRFRNRLVHMYWDVDPVQLCRILQENLGDLDAFRDFMIAYLQHQPMPD